MSAWLDHWFFHWAPEKAVWIAGHTLSWDARCAGIYVGLGIGVLAHLFAGRKAQRLPRRGLLMASGVLFLPLFTDVALQTGSNDLRFLTGILFGEAFSVFLYPAFALLVLAGDDRACAMRSVARFIGLVAAGIGAFALKAFDHVAAFYILQSLAALGAASLFVMLGWGAVAGLFATRGERKWRESASARG